VAGVKGSTWLAPVPGAEGYWLEVPDAAAPEAEAIAALVLPPLGGLLEAEGQLGRLAGELADRYEEIDLLYAISEILGQTLRIEEASRTILREVATVVGARRGAILVADEESPVLRRVALRGDPPPAPETIATADPAEPAAHAFRERHIVERGEAAGGAMLAVPICYAAPGAALRCVGVIQLADRVGGADFTPADRKLVTAVANQVGAAIENARLLLRDLKQQRLRRELELAHDLQLRLLPSPDVLAGAADVAVRCIPAESVGGDFYTFGRLGGGRVGVMLGDVSSHGFSAALVMALVLSAAGIHSGSVHAPDETLRAMFRSLEDELETAEMYFTIFYGVLDPFGHRLVYANAGHPHAFRLPPEGPAVRLESTAPPIGLGPAAEIGRARVDWRPGHDLLCLWTDGLVEARSEAGEPFGEERLLAELGTRRSLPSERIVSEVLELVDAHSPAPADDRTLLVLRL
jgi:sigma-B regulation protein RsbU (phosphoserine phosphatase)